MKPKPKPEPVQKPQPYEDSTIPIGTTGQFGEQGSFETRDNPNALFGVVPPQDGEAL